MDVFKGQMTSPVMKDLSDNRALLGAKQKGGGGGIAGEEVGIFMGFCQGINRYFQ